MSQNSRNEKVKIFQRAVFFFISFLVCHGKLLPLHNLIKSELFYFLEIWGYEQKKVQNSPNSQKERPVIENQKRF